MFTFYAIGIQGMAYWAMLFIITLIIAVAGVYFLVSNRKLFEKKNIVLLSSAQNISELERCDIANLDAVHASLCSSDYELLHSAADRIVDDSARIYQGKWICDPHKLFTLENLLTRGEFTALSYEVPIQMLTISFLCSGVFWLIGRSLFSSEYTNVMNLAAWPLLIGLLFSLLIFFASQRQRNELKRSMNYLAEMLTRRLPIFEELAGTAVLIDSFVQYDREMVESVSVLSETVQGLVDHQLAEKVAENVRIVMEKEIAPAIQSSTQNLAALSETLQQRQEKGMSELAGLFTQQLGAKLNHELTPLFLETDHLVEELHNASSGFDLSMQALSQAREDSLHIQEQTKKALADLSESREQWSQDLRATNTSLERLGQVCEKLEGLYSGENESLGADIKQLSQSIEVWNTRSNEESNRFTEAINTYSQTLQSELGEHNRQLQDALQTQNASMLEAYQQQTDHFAEALGEQNLRFAERITDVIDRFENQLQTRVGQASEEIKTLVTQLNRENGELAKLLDNLGNGSAAMVGDIRRLSFEMNQNADRLSHQSEAIDETLTELTQKLQSVIIDFSDKMRQTVADTLQDFDQNIADISLRLSTSGAEMTDSAQRIADTLHEREKSLHRLSSTEQTETTEEA